MDQPQTFSRTIPGGTLVVVTILLGLHHLYVKTQGEYIVFAMFGLPMLWMLALGGTVYPPVFFSLGKYGRHLPVWLKVVAAVLGLAGFGVAFYLATVLY
jgi:hypothetical protein